MIEGNVKSNYWKWLDARLLQTRGNMCSRTPRQVPTKTPKP